MYLYFFVIEFLFTLVFLHCVFSCVSKRVVCLSALPWEMSVTPHTNPQKIETIFFCKKEEYKIEIKVDLLVGVVAPISFKFPALPKRGKRGFWAMPRFCGLLRTFVVKMLQVAFMRFCRQIHQSARIGVRGGAKPILAMPGF